MNSGAHNADKTPPGIYCRSIARLQKLRKTSRFCIDCVSRYAAAPEETYPNKSPLDVHPGALRERLSPLPQTTEKSQFIAVFGIGTRNYSPTQTLRPIGCRCCLFSLGVFNMNSGAHNAHKTSLRDLLPLDCTPTKTSKISRFYIDCAR